MSTDLAVQPVADPDLADFVARESAQREQAITELRLKYEGRTIAGKDDKEGYELVRIGIREMTSLRTSIEKRRKQLKADALAWERRVDSEAKRLTALVEEIEEPLRQAKAAIDDEKARIKREAEEAERRAIEENIRLEREAEEARLRAEQEAISEKHRLEREQLEREKAILAAQRGEIEAQQRAERERVESEQKAERDRVAAERAKMDAERKAIQEERDKLAREEWERQAKTRAEQEARERVQREQEQAELRRLETERKSAEERQRLEALRPDKEKIGAFTLNLKMLPWPTVNAKEAKAVLGRAVDDMKRIVADLEAFAK